MKDIAQQEVVFKDNNAGYLEYVPAEHTHKDYLKTVLVYYFHHYMAFEDVAYEKADLNLFFEKYSGATTTRQDQYLA